MNINFKLVAGFAAFAFIFSFFTGLFSGNDFLIVLLRSVLGSVFFAVLGGGIGYVIDRFFPDLWPTGEAGGGEEEDTGQAEEVDITLPEENPHERADYLSQPE